MNEESKEIDLLRILVKERQSENKILEKNGDLLRKKVNFLEKKLKTYENRTGTSKTIHVPSTEEHDNSRNYSGVTKSLAGPCTMTNGNYAEKTMSRTETLNSKNHIRENKVTERSRISADVKEKEDYQEQMTTDHENAESQWEMQKKQGFKRNHENIHRNKDEVNKNGRFSKSTRPSTNKRDK